MNIFVLFIRKATMSHMFDDGSNFSFNSRYGLFGGIIISNGKLEYSYKKLSD